MIKFNNTMLQSIAYVAMPADAGTGEPPKRYTWDEDSVNWIEVQDGN
jgi:hypothetical protein